MIPLKPLLLGEAPSAGGDRFHDFPLSGIIGKRLCEFAGIEPDAKGSQYGKYYWPLRERFDCINAIERYRDAYPWRVGVARERVREYLEENPTRVVVALGIRAADAVGVREVSWGGWITLGDMRVAIIPHPSGRNLLYNQAEFRTLARQVLREAMEVE